LQQKPNPYPLLGPPVAAAQAQFEQDTAVNKPQKANSNEPDGLRYGFDMEPEERVGFSFDEPPRNGTSGKKGFLATHQKDYLWYLVKLALQILNRELCMKDFRVLTEAFNRRFLSAVHNEKVFHERGWNAIHSRVTRSKEYPELVQCVLGKKKTIGKEH
jgi:hypothetical protein